MKKILLILLMVLLISSCFNSNEENILTDSWNILTHSWYMLIDTENMSFTDDNRIILNNYTINKVFYEDDLLWNIMKEINIIDFENMKLLKSKWQDIDNKIEIEWEILDVIFQNLIAAKAFNDKIISYCDKTNYVDATWNSYWERCKADYYLVDLFVNKNYELCNNFNDIYKEMWVMWLNIEPKKVCNEFVTLLKNDNINENDIEDTLKLLYSTDNLDSDILNLFKSILLKTDSCWDIEVLSTKLICLNIYNGWDIFTDFKNNTYNKLINTKYLFN
jgi:hypothetical protein